MRISLKVALIVGMVLLSWPHPSAAVEEMEEELYFPDDETGELMDA